MRKSFSTALACVLVLALSDRAAATNPVQAHPVQASYTAYWSGFSVMTLDASLNLGEEAYRVAATMRTTGVLSAFVRGEQNTLVEGRIASPGASFGLLPSRFTMEGLWRDRARRISMAWRDGQPEVLALLPESLDEREPVPAALQRDTVDTLTALAALVRQVAANGRCDGAAQIFDGRRRSDFSAVTESTDALAPHRWGSFAGPALRCRFEGRQVAGFWKAQDRAEASKPRGGTAWLASPGPGLPVIPVRLEAESAWGTVYIHLTRAARGELALPTQHTAN